MKILLTGANGYIGQRLIPRLLEEGHELVCAVRDKSRVYIPPDAKKLSLIEVDFLQPETLTKIPDDIDVAYYLIHSMSSLHGDFAEMENRAAHNFVNAMKRVKQVIYLSGISNDEKLSKHLQSRRSVETVLAEGDFALTVLRAAIIIGSGSASFEIIRDLVEKLPVMATPKWVESKCQPIAVADVLRYLTAVVLKEECFDKTFDIAGPDVLSYREMLSVFAEMRGLKRLIIPVPVMSPGLSAYWLYFVTSTSYPLAKSLVSSLKNEVVAELDGLEKIVPGQCYSYGEALERAFVHINENQVVSSWADSFSSINRESLDLEEKQVPVYGCYKDIRTVEITDDIETVRQNIWSIGGERGWYHMDWIWRLRGFVDKLMGGIGLRRGRDSKEPRPGDLIDFWRVLVVDQDASRLVLFAEMKLPGEGWLEFKIVEKDGKKYFRQIATFRPQGLFGRLYWLVLIPVHNLLFQRMAQRIVSFKA